MKQNKGSNPIIVVGPGRCGTSIVSKLLGEVGVFMGNRFRNGYYEDLDFKEPTDLFLDGKIAFSPWYDAINALSSFRATLPKWGFKDPRICSILGMYLPVYENPLFIRCRRKHEDVVHSMVNNTEWSSELAAKIARGRNEALDRVLKGQNVIEFDFSRRVDEEELSNELEKIVETFYSYTSS